MNEMLHSCVGHGGALMFTLVFLEQAGLPIPAAPCLLAAGALYPTGQAVPLILLGPTILACLIADTVWFLIGRRGGKSILSLLGRFTSSGNGSMQRLEARLLRQGMPLVTVAKFVPGLSLVISPLAGAMGVDLRRFLLFDLLGSLLYAGIYFLLGIIFSEQLQACLETLHQLGFGALLLVAVAVGAFLIGKQAWRKTGGRSVKSEKTPDGPVLPGKAF